MRIFVHTNGHNNFFFLPSYLLFYLRCVHESVCLCVYVCACNCFVSFHSALWYILSKRNIAPFVVIYSAQFKTIETKTIHKQTFQSFIFGSVIKAITIQYNHWQHTVYAISYWRNSCFFVIVSFFLLDWTLRSSLKIFLYLVVPISLSHAYSPCVICVHNSIISLLSTQFQCGHGLVYKLKLPFNFSVSQLLRVVYVDSQFLWYTQNTSWHANDA